MEELVVAVNDIAEAVNAPMGFYELLLIVIPIGVSVVALYVSIITVQMQKKMDLFDKRYDVYYQVKEIIKFKDEIKKCSFSK